MGGSETSVEGRQMPPKKLPGNAREISENWKKLRKDIVQKEADISQKKPKKVKISNGSSTQKKSVSTHGDRSKPPSKKNRKVEKNGEMISKKNSNKSSPQKKAKSGDSLAELCKEKSSDGLTRCVAIDCEMVGTGFGGRNSSLARISIVNLYGHCIYDKYVKPIEDVTDYRTEVSGIRPENLVRGEDFRVVQKEVYDIIKNRILIGHSINYDLKVLYLSHPKHQIRDTSSYFRRFYNNRTPSLKQLAEDLLGVKIQDGEHSSVVDAQATMRLYTLYKKKWESKLAAKTRRKPPPPQLDSNETTQFIERFK